MVTSKTVFIEILKNMRAISIIIIFLFIFSDKYKDIVFADPVACHQNVSALTSRFAGNRKKYQIIFRNINMVHTPRYMKTYNFQNYLKYVIFMSSKWQYEIFQIDEPYEYNVFNNVYNSNYFKNHC